MEWKQSVDGLKAPVEEFKANMQETLDEAKQRSDGVKSELGRMKQPVKETQTVLGEVKETLSASAEVLYKRKRYLRLFSRKRKPQTTKARRL